MMTDSFYANQSFADKEIRFTAASNAFSGLNILWLAMAVGLLSAKFLTYL
jgi:hypothetical protein